MSKYMTATIRCDHFADGTGVFIKTEHVDVLFKDVDQLGRIMDEIAAKNLSRYFHNVKCYVEEIH